MRIYNRLSINLINTLKFIDSCRKYMALGDKQHEKQQDSRIKKLENDLKQQKSTISKLEKRIKSLENRKTVKKTKKSTPKKKQTSIWD